jgi:hypothetical protein
VQNLVFYGVSQNTGKWLSHTRDRDDKAILLSGRWLSNPYVAFGAGALVEIVAYCVVHLVLDRWGRKLPFCAFVFFFGIVAFTVVPIQMLMVKDSHGR